MIVMFRDKQPVAVFHAIALLFALSFIPASFTACLVEERASGSKHLQLISGLSNTMYWLHVITWDLVIPFVLYQRNKKPMQLLLKTVILIYRVYFVNHEKMIILVTDDQREFDSIFQKFNIYKIVCVRLYINLM